MAILNPPPQNIPDIANDRSDIEYFKSLKDSVFQIWTTLKELVNNPQTGYTEFSNLSTNRTLDADSTTVEELADTLGTLIEDLKNKNLIGE